jgi:hypothetical protein
MQVAVPNTCRRPRSSEVTGAGGGDRSGLAEHFADAALSELVLADNALGVDAQQHIHAVPGPLGYLCGEDAAV